MAKPPINMQEVWAKDINDLFPDDDPLPYKTVVEEGIIPPPLPDPIVPLSKWHYLRLVQPGDYPVDNHKVAWINQPLRPTTTRVVRVQT